MNRYLRAACCAEQWRPNESCDVLARRLVDACSAKLGARRPSFGLLFASPRNRKSPKRSYEAYCRLAEAVYREVPGAGDTPMMGCSLAAVLGPTGKLLHGVSLCLLECEDLKVTLECADVDPDDLVSPIRNLARRLTTSGDGEQSRDGYGMVISMYPGYLGARDAAQTQRQWDLIYVDHHLHRELCSAIGYSYPVVGTSAADGFQRRVGHVFANGRVHSSAVAAAFLRTSARFGSAMTHALEKTMHVVRFASVEGATEGRTVLRLAREHVWPEDSTAKPEDATSVVSQVQADLGGDGPLVFGATDAAGEVSATWTFRQLPGGAIRLTKPVLQGSSAHVLAWEPRNIHQLAADAVDKAIADGPLAHPRLVLCFCCAALCEGQGPDTAVLPESLIPDSVRRLPGELLFCGGLGFGEHGSMGASRALSGSYLMSALALGDELYPPARDDRTARHLMRVSEHIVQATTEDGVADALLDGVMRFGYDGAMLSTVRRDRRMISAIGARGDGWREIVGQTQRPMDLPEGVLDILPWTLQQRTPIYVADSREEAPRCDPEAVRVSGVVSQLLIPVYVRDSAFGVLQVGLSRSDPLTDMDKSALVALANLAAVHIARLRQTRLTRELDAGVMAALQQPAADDSLSALVAHATSTLQAVSGHVRVSGGERDELALVGGAGPCYQALRSVRPVLERASDGGSWLARAANERIVVHDADSDERSRALRARYRGTALGDVIAGLRSWVSVPMRQQAEVVGTLNFESDVPYFFDTDTLEVVETLADRVVTLVRNMELHKALVEANRQLNERTDQMQDMARLGGAASIASAVSHQVKNSLNNAKQLCEALRQMLPDNVRTRERRRLLSTISAIDGEVLSAAEFVRRVQSMTSGEQPIERTDINAAIDDAFEALQTRLKRVSASVNLDLDRNCPYMLASPVALMELFSNLALNALDAIDHGGRITVRTRYDRSSGAIEIRFGDDGCGIAQQDLPLIWDPLYTRKRRSRGTGLGLFRVMEIVGGMRGEISVSSKKGKGTTFTARLPTGRA
ncbi:ATP-binding protein [Candidatus Latescibacterota bacterium]